MKRGLIALGIAGPFLLAACVILLLVSVGGWFLLKPEQKSQIIRIIPVAPLATPQAEILPEAVAGVTEAAPAAESPAEFAAPAPATPAPAAPNDPIQQILGFALPPGSVNSVTREGVGTRIVIPKLSVDAPIVLAPIKDQTWQVDHLGQAVGHLEGTAPPGSDSNLVLAGHVTLSASVYGPFAGLGQLATGDEVIVYEGDQAFQYVVDGYQTVERTAVDVTYPSNTGQITLITCNNWSNEEGRYLQRLIVKGHLVKN
jgi:LPXTG-site transpeptidase (sortase) family protein